MSYKKNKYFAKKVILDGITFDSRHEADRYCELKLLQKANEIRDLNLQVPFELIPAQYEEVETYTPKTKKKKITKKLLERSIEYVADFTYYTKNGEYIVEDAKGYKLGEAYKIFVIKRKLMYYIHHIKVKEV